MTTALEGVRGSVTPRLLFTPGKNPVPIAQEAGWAPGWVWTGAENLCSRKDQIFVLICEFLISYVLPEVASC